MRYAAITSRLNGLGSEKWAVHLEGRRRAALGHDLIFLSIGEPDAAPPAGIFDVAEKQLRAGRTKYSNGRGETTILNALSTMYSTRTGRRITTNQFLFLPGTQTALYTAMMTLVDSGDEVLMADPYYATYESVIAAAGGIPIPVRLSPDEHFHLDASAVEKAITPATRVLLMNTPSNPTGAVFTAGEIARIGAVCTKHNLWIISDEVYATLTYGDHVFASPFDNLDLADRTVVVSSISKSHALPGLRCGWIAASEGFCEKALPISETMLFGSQPFLEDATAFALSSHFPEIDVMKCSYERRAKKVVSVLKKSKSASAQMPEGGMFVMVDIRNTGLSGDAFARKLLDEENVVTMPGESFGAGGAGHVRVALTVSEEQMAEACRRIVALAERL